jgi:hypothetical protein
MLLYSKGTLNRIEKIATVFVQKTLKIELNRVATMYYTSVSGCIEGKLVYPYKIKNNLHQRLQHRLLLRVMKNWYL